MLTRVLITVMTFPALSTKHVETVCTAGFREDGTWIRIYPVPHRLLEDKKKYKKWQWIEVNLEKNPKDRRPESYHIVDIETLKVLEPLDNRKPVNWKIRLDWLSKGKQIFTNASEVIMQKEVSDMSLAVLKPNKILKFYFKKVEDISAYNERLERIKSRYIAKKQQQSIFEENSFSKDFFTFAKKFPYEFKFKFITDDGKERNWMFEDWEVYELLRKCSGEGEKEGLIKVINKYEELIKNSDIYFLVGTDYKRHVKNYNHPFIILGMVPIPKPKETPQYTLDF